jgi:hypothetical protein
MKISATVTQNPVLVTLDCVKSEVKEDADELPRKANKFSQKKERAIVN